MQDRIIKTLANCDDIVLDCNKKLEAVLTVSESMANIMDPNDVINAVIYKLGQELGYTFPALFLFNETKTELLMKKIGVHPSSQRSYKKFFQHGFHDLAFSTRSKKNIVVRCSEEKQIVISKDLSLFTRPYLTEEQTDLLHKYLDVHLIITVPLVLKDEVIGVLVAFSKRDSLEETEQVLLQTLANHVSMVLHNAQLFDRIRVQVEDLEDQRQDLLGLLQLSKIARSSLQKETVLQDLLDAIPEDLEHLGALGGGVLLIGEKNESVQMAGLTENTLAKTIRKKLKLDWFTLEQKIASSELLQTVLRRSQPVVCTDLSQMFPDTIKKTIGKKVMQLSGAKSFIALPLVKGKHTFGLLILPMSEEVKHLDSRRQEIFALFADQISVTLENVELYERLQEEYLKGEKQREALVVANERLQALDQAKSEFISIASHQLRTPLTVIKGYLSMVLEGAAGSCDSVATESIKRVASSTDRLVNLVNDLLDISRIERGMLNLDRKPARLELLAESVVDELGSIAEKSNVSLSFRRPRKASTKVKVDKKKVREVMYNMIDNAIKYAPKGKVEVSIRTTKSDVVFQVKDNGMGLSPHTIPKLFEKFSRGEGVSVIDTEGVGLGLFVAKRIIDAHDGKIWADSKGKGKGSTFSFSIPVTK